MAGVFGPYISDILLVSLSNSFVLCWLQGVTTTNPNFGSYSKFDFSFSYI